MFCIVSIKVKNKAPAPVQITAEQLLREAKERQLELVPPVSELCLRVPKDNVLCKVKSACSKTFLIQAPKGKSQWSTIQRCLYQLQSDLFNADSKGTWPSVQSTPPGFKPCLSRCFLRQGTLLHFVSLHQGIKMGTGDILLGGNPGMD